MRRIQARRPAVQQKALVFGGEIMCDVIIFPEKFCIIAGKEKDTESRDQKRSADSVFYFTEKGMIVYLGNEIAAGNELEI